jgi:hypothetical protein
MKETGKERARRLARGPHWVCYHCDHIVERESEPCPRCGDVHHIGRCNGQCVRCLEEFRAKADAIVQKAIAKMRGERT